MFKKTRMCQAAMLALSSGVLLAALPGLAQAQRVEITGTSIKRVEAEGALQVQTLTRADIDRTGVQTTEQLLQTISAMSSAGQTQLPRAWAFRPTVRPACRCAASARSARWCWSTASVWPRLPAAAAARSTSTTFRWRRSSGSRF